jgi:hypothetical protein
MMKASWTNYELRDLRSVLSYYGSMYERWLKLKQCTFYLLCISSSSILLPPSSIPRICDRPALAARLFLLLLFLEALQRSGGCDAR